MPVTMFLAIMEVGLDIPKQRLCLQALRALWFLLLYWSKFGSDINAYDQESFVVESEAVAPVPGTQISIQYCFYQDTTRRAAITQQEYCAVYPELGVFLLNKPEIFKSPRRFLAVWEKIKTANQLGYVLGHFHEAGVLPIQVRELCPKWKSNAELVM